MIIFQTFGKWYFYLFADGSKMILLSIILFHSISVFYNIYERIEKKFL